MGKFEEASAQAADALMLDQMRRVNAFCRFLAEHAPPVTKTGEAVHFDLVMEGE